jgi:hypothetical protein
MPQVPRELSPEEKVVLSQTAVEMLFPTMQELEDKHGLSRCQALTAMAVAVRSMHLTVHRDDQQDRSAAPWN